MIRLISLQIRNVRGVNDRTIKLCEDDNPSFDQLRGVTVISGPNEIGKTTTLDALRVLLDFPDSSTATDVKSLKTVGTDAAPEITACLMVGDDLLTYSKRYLSKPTTHLEVVGTEPGRWDGRDAHDEARRRIADKVDEQMWQRLQLHQSSSTQNRELTDLESLNKVLSQQTGTTAIGELELGIRDRVRAAKNALFTEAQNRPTAELKQAIAEVTRCTEEIDGLRARRSKLHEDIDRFARLEATLPDRRNEAARLQAEVSELAREVDEVEKITLALKHAELEVQQSRDHVRRLEDEQDRRQATEAELDALRRGLEALQCEITVTVAELGNATTQLEEHRAEEQQLRNERQTISTALGEARAETEREHLTARLELIGRQIRAVSDLNSAIEELTRQLKAIDLPEGSAAELEHLDERRRQAEAERDAALPRLEVEARESFKLRLDGQEPVLLEPGGSWRSEPERSLTVELGHFASVRLRGANTEALIAAATQASETLAQRAAELGVSGPAEARRVESKRQQLKDLLEQRMAARDASMTDADLAEYRDEQARLQARLAALPPAAQPARGQDAATRDSDINELESRATGLDDRLATLAGTIQNELEPALRELRERKVSLDAKQVQYTDQLAQQLQELEEDRAETSDADIATQLERARTQLEIHQQKARQTRDTLSEANPEALRERHEDRHRALALRRSELVRDEQELHTLTGRIDAQQGDGLAEAIGAAEQHLLHAQERERGLRRQAAAAGLLTEILDDTITRTSRERSEPLRQQLLRYGRVLYGDDFDIRLNTSLQIAERRKSTAEGWLPYDALSAGAKEQLELLVLLSCASLLGEKGGIAIIDDALGNSDPARTRLLGPVFNAAGEHCQVLVLTCDPQRYTSLTQASRLSM